MAAVLELARGRFHTRTDAPLSSIPIDCNERGRLMEARVASILERLDSVEKAMINPKHSQDDREGRDLTITLAQGLPIGIVWAEVKPNEKRANEYRRKLARRLRQQHDPRSTSEWMAANCQILINGGVREEEIAASFTGQLARIETAYRGILKRGS